MLSIITPAFNESTNLEALHARIVETMARLGGDWEWLIVDDHSRDDTFEVIRRLARANTRVRGIRLARNSGSHIAITCGLHHVRGAAAVMMASDLQDPPETLGVLLDRWRQGAQVVWAMRRERPGEASHAGFAAVYYWIMRHVVGMKEMPARGADFFLVDRAVIDAFRRFPERNMSVFALITWMGFRQDYVEYDKQPRTSGRSGWTTAKKIKLVVDSVTGFSDAPIRWCSLAGAAFVVIAVLVLAAGVGLWPGLGAAVVVLLGALVGLSGIQLLAIGVIGEYVWRSLDESRRRPSYIVEAATDDVASIPV
jgi:dolichol-phosphate mannosyltransferase